MTKNTITSDSDTLTQTHAKLTHSQFQKVTSHIQREEGDWMMNTLMIEGCDIAFQYKRKKAYQSLKGARVDITYYPDTKTIGGFELEIFKVVRVRRS